METEEMRWLLELAAKAAGYAFRVEKTQLGIDAFYVDGHRWNPLEDDGDALRLAVPLSRVNPRQGRFLKLLPAILIYMTYLALLIAARGALDKGKIPPQLGLWWVHGVFLVLGLLLLYWEPIRLKWASRRAVREVTHG